MTAKAGSSDARQGAPEELEGVVWPINSSTDTTMGTVRRCRVCTAARGCKRKGSEVGSAMRRRRALAFLLDEAKQLSGPGDQMCLQSVRCRHVGSKCVQRPSRTPRKSP